MSSAIKTKLINDDALCVQFISFLLWNCILPKLICHCLNNSIPNSQWFLETFHLYDISLLCYQGDCDLQQLLLESFVCNVRMQKAIDTT